MDPTKHPEIILSAVTAGGLVLSVFYYQKRIGDLETRLAQLEAHKANEIKKVGELLTGRKIYAEQFSLIKKSQEALVKHEDKNIRRLYDLLLTQHEQQVEIAEAIVALNGEKVDIEPIRSSKKDRKHKKEKSKKKEKEKKRKKEKKRRKPPPVEDSSSDSSDNESTSSNSSNDSSDSSDVNGYVNKIIGRKWSNKFILWNQRMNE